jgi:adenylate cyclase class 2
MENREIEVKFLEIDPADIADRLEEAGAVDLGEHTLSETVFYDAAGAWPGENKFVRVRRVGNDTLLTFKHSDEKSVDGTVEIEFSVPDAESAAALMEAIGLVRWREQEKRRHSFRLGEVMADIDTWPAVPTYLELEGPSEEALRHAAALLKLPWEKKVTGTAAGVIEKYYGIQVKKLRVFTFSKRE